MNPHAFWRQSALLFVAMRAGDAINLFAALWLVPRYIAPDALGAVLPVTTFTTCLALPVFAFAMTFMRESAVLAFNGEFGKLRTLFGGVFTATAVLLVLSLALAAALVPRFLAILRISDAPAAFFAVAAAFLGCFAPVYTHALSALKRFGSLATAEITAAAARLAALFAFLPIRAFAGYFAGNAVQPLARIAVTAFALRRDLAVPRKPYWTRETVRRLGISFLAVTAYQLAPMLASLAEQTVLRTDLPGDVSAGYYLATRLTDALNYVTLPLLIVLFPHAADEASASRSVRPYVLRCAAVTVLVALVWCGLLACCGETFLGWLPQGARHASYAPYMPALVAVNLLGILQVFCTNALVAAGRYRFLAWMLPLSLGYALALASGLIQVRSFDALLGWMLAFAAARALCAFASVRRR